MTATETKPNCVCGHPATRHHRDECIGCEAEVGDHCCGCMKYRPALPWPDADGWWWFMCASLLPQLVRVIRRLEGDLAVFIMGAPGFSTRDECDREFGPARFVKLQEENPFASED